MLHPKTFPGSCNVGEVIIHKNLDNFERPKRIQTFFEGKNQEAKMGTQSCEINSTGMYYLYFIFCGHSYSGKNCVEEPWRLFTWEDGPFDDFL